MLAIPKRKIKVWRLVVTYIEFNTRYSIFNCVNEVLQRVTWFKTSSVTLNDKLRFVFLGLKLAWVSKEAME
jgi:hypothetical protein